MQKKIKPKKENNERWLLTYSDLITLLMILFILLYAISAVDQSKYDQLSKSLSSALGGGNGVLPGGNSILPSEGSLPGDGSLPSEDSSPTDDNAISPQTSLPNDASTKEAMQNVQNYVDTIIKDLNVKSSISTSVRTNGLTISFIDDIFFDSGKAELTDTMKTALDKIAPLLNNFSNKIMIEGHTDNIKPSDHSPFSSNWQLSASRAANVVEYLTSNGHVDGSRMSAVGYGEYRPVGSNDTSTGRQKNRRIDIIITYNNME